MRGKAHTSILRASLFFPSSLSLLCPFPSIPPHLSSLTSMKDVNERTQLELKATLVLKWESYGSAEKNVEGRKSGIIKQIFFLLTLTELY